MARRLRGGSARRLFAACLVWALLCISFAITFTAAAEEDAMDDVLAGFDDDDDEADDDVDSMDDVLDGFGDSDGFQVDPTPSEQATAPEDRIWNLQGDLNLGLSASLHDHESSGGNDYSGLQRFRTKLALQFDLDLPKKWKIRASGYGFYDLAYVMNGRSNYKNDPFAPGDVLDTYEYDFQLTDTYLEGSLHDQVDLKIGRQVVNWGRSESIRVLDIVNPLNNREPGLVDIEDIRRSVAMAKFGFFSGPWTLTVLVIPEVRYDILPAMGSDQAPEIELTELLARATSLSVDPAVFNDGRVAPDFGNSTEFAMNLTGVFSGWDLSVQAARYNDDRAHFDLSDLRFEHSRLWMAGSGANYTVGSWLVKAEIAFVDGLGFLGSSSKKSRVDTIVGVEYYGLNDVNIVFEVAQRHIDGFESAMKLFPDFAQKDTLESALRVSVDLMNDQIHLTMLGFVIGEKAQDGSFVRLSAEYDVIDALSVQVGFLLFQSGDNIGFANAGKNDRFFTSAKYSF